MWHRARTKFSFLLVILAMFPVYSHSEGNKPDKPGLVVMLIIDQLRASTAKDLGERQAGGVFQRLYKQGIVYENAYYDYASTLTAPGHASLATGVLPSEHGVISNFWLNTQTMRRITSVVDPETFILDIGQHKIGASPVQLMAPTLADHIIKASAGKAKAISVSVKDRGAIFTAGKSGKAFWFSSEFGKFVTSSYYYDDSTLPEWLTEFNNKAFSDLPTDWKLLYANNKYRRINQDDRKNEHPPKGMKKTFPHRFSRMRSKEYFNQLKRSPFVEQITLDLARTVLEKEQLGMDEHTDLLSISLSAGDYIGHDFGPNSLEKEDYLYRLEQYLNTFIELLEKKYSKENFLLVISSDHGTSLIVETIPETGINTTRVYPIRLALELNKHLKTSFRIRNNLVHRIIRNNLYLDKEAIQERKLNLDVVLDTAIEWLGKQPSIARAISVKQLENCKEEAMCRMVKNSVYPGRSGEIYIVPQETAIFSLEPPIYAANHGSPYDWDRHVPVIFFGMDIQNQLIKRQIKPRSIAPTIADLLDLKPLGTDQERLSEILP